MTDTLFFRLSKLVWAVIAPDNFVLIALTIICILLYRGYRKGARTLLLLLVSCLWLIVLLPVSDGLLLPLETRFPTHPPLPVSPDGIIMLGGAEKTEASQAWRQVELKAYAERALAFMQLARRYPDAKLVFAGGSGHPGGGDWQEADVAEMLFKQQGLNVSRILLLRNARNTYENAVIARAKVKPEAGESWLLITSASHMPRAVGVFCRIGWPVIPYPVDHWAMPDETLGSGLSFAGSLEKLTYAVREWVGLTAYYLTGKTEALIPGLC